MKFRVLPNLGKEAGTTVLTGSLKNTWALGPSAHSFDGVSRQWNIANNALYIKSLKTGRLHFESENLQPRDMLNEYIMTSLRTMEGLDLQYVSEHFGKEKESLLGK